MSKETDLEKRDTLFDKVARFYQGEGSLSPVEAEICKRWVTAFALLQEHRSKPVAIKKYIEVYQGKVSVNTAYSDFRNAELIFVPLHKISKDMHRLIIIEQIDKQIEKLEAKQRGEPKDENGIPSIVSEKLYADLQHEIDRLLATKVKATGIEHTDINLPDFSKLQPVAIQINLPPSQINMIKDMAKGGVFDLSDYYNNIPEAEIVKDDEQRDQDS